MALSIVNGNAYAFCNIELSTPLPIAGIKSINYKDNLTRQMVRGTASVPIGLTRGKYEASGDIEFYLAAAQLAVFNSPGWRMLQTAMTVSYGPNDNGLMCVDIIPVAFYGELEASQSEGDEPLTRKCSLIIPNQILWDGMPSVIETFSLIAVA